MSQSLGAGFRADHRSAMGAMKSYDDDDDDVDDL